VRAPISILEFRSVRGTGGGPEKTILLGTAQRDRSRFAVTVCYIRDLRDDVFRIDQRAQSMDVDYVEARERHSFDWRIWAALKQIIVDERIDIVHAHDYKTILWARLLAHRTGVIPMATAHGWTGRSARERLLYYPLAKRLLARLPRAVVVSNDLKEDLVRHGGRADRITVLLNAIDSGAFVRVADRRDPARQALGLEPGTFVIGAVGRLEHQKRFDLLLAAMASLASSHPNVRLVIVGDGSLRADLIHRAETLGISGHCRFPGHRDDIADLHHAFDVFVQSSEYEGTPNAVLEAMAMETPVIATDVGGTRELVTSGVDGIVVCKNDTLALRSAIEAVLDQPGTARARAVAARHRVETEFSFNARTRRLETIYEDLIRERDQARGRLAAPLRVPDA
jgi:glycosyltransferase involved in cell wall biosynthesis